MKSETLSKIAGRLGLSTTTISRVLNDKAEKYRIPKETCDLVRAEVRRCGYVLPSVAQNLRNVKSGLIGLMLPAVSNPFFADMAGVIISEMNKRRYTTIVVDTMEDEANQADSIKALMSRQVEGIIAAPCGDDSLYLEKVNESVPVVLVDRFYKDTTLPYVTTNSYQGSLMATRHLIANGHRKIACIQGATLSMPNRERVKGYEDAMKAENLQDNICVVGNDFSIQNGYLETKILLTSPSRPTAIYALSNTILLGACKAIREASLRVPEDISIIAFDNNLYMDYMIPVITRISQPVDDMARLASKILLDKLDTASLRVSQLRLAPTLIQGESVLRI